MADFKKFEEVWRPIYLQDPVYAETAKFLLEDAITRTDQAAQKEYAEIILKHSGKDGWLNIAYVGVVYDELGDTALAEDCFQRNLDNGRGINVNLSALSNLRQGRKAAEGIAEFAELMEQYEASNDLQALIRMAEKGFPDAQGKLGRAYINGLDAPKILPKLSNGALWPLNKVTQLGKLF